MININLIAERRARKLHEMTVIRWATMGVLLVFLAMISLNIMMWSTKEANAKACDVAKDELATNTKAQVELRNVQEQIAEKEPVVVLLEQVRGSEAAWVTILADISRIIPHDIALTTIGALPSRDQTNLRLIGRARDENAIAVFMSNLKEQTGWAEGYKLNSTFAENDQKTGQPGVRFDFTVQVREMRGGDF